MYCLKLWHQAVLSSQAIAGRGRGNSPNAGDSEYLCRSGMSLHLLMRYSISERIPGDVRGLGQLHEIMLWTSTMLLRCGAAT